MPRGICKGCRCCGREGLPSFYAWYSWCACLHMFDWTLWPFVWRLEDSQQLSEKKWTPWPESSTVSNAVLWQKKCLLSCPCMHVCTCYFNCCSMHMLLACHEGPHALTCVEVRHGFMGHRGHDGRLGLCKHATLDKHIYIYYYICIYILYIYIEISVDSDFWLGYLLLLCLTGRSIMHAACIHASNTDAFMRSYVCFSILSRPCPFLSGDPWWDCWWTPTCLRPDPYMHAKSI